MLTLTGIAYRPTWKSMIGQGLKSMHPDVGALWLQTTTLKYMSASIACKEITVRKSSHPWLSKRVQRAVSDIMTCSVVVCTPMSRKDKPSCVTHVGYHIYINSIYFHSPTDDVCSLACKTLILPAVSDIMTCSVEKARVSRLGKKSKVQSA